EDPRYEPPATPGFWSGRPSQPESFYADESRARVLVTETRTVLYPLATGVATIGSATASLVFASPEDESFRWLAGRPRQREATIESPPVHLRVRALPPGPPAGFDGAVGSFVAAWSADRDRTS